MVLLKMRSMECNSVLLKKWGYNQRYLINKHNKVLNVLWSSSSLGIVFGFLFYFAGHSVVNGVRKVKLPDI